MMAHQIPVSVVFPMMLATCLPPVFMFSHHLCVRLLTAWCVVFVMH